MAWTQNSFDFTKVEQGKASTQNLFDFTKVEQDSKGLNTKLVRLY